MKVIYFIIIFFLSSYALSEEKEFSFIEIISDKLVIRENPLTSEFFGDVYAIDGVNEFWGEKMIVDYDSNKKIKLITVEGNVIIERLNEKVTGQTAIYTIKTEEIKVIGNVILIKDGNILKGDEYTEI